MSTQQTVTEVFKGDESWQTKASNKRATELSKIPKEWRLSPEYLTGDATSDANVIDIPAKCGILTADELHLTEDFDAVTLARLVQSGAVKAQSVATAICKRAAIAQQLTNCLTETFFDDAIKRGEWLDRYLEEHKKPVGPLHGVPVSIKDSFNYVGVASTIGYVSFLENPFPKANSPLVDILLGAGAILYCKTNIPQSLMTADSDNNVFGKVLNPHKLRLGAGGSSGGEGALVAMRGSVLGVGTDIGGSIRIPALCCGTYGFKPSAHRVPSGGQTGPGRPGSPGFPAVAGPLANSFEDLHLFIRSVLEAKPWDSDATALAIPWRTSVAYSTLPQLRIGFLREDKAYPIHPPVARALDDAAKTLSAAGFTVISLTDFPSVETGLDIATDCFSLDNTKRFLKQIKSSGEPLVPSLERTFWTVNKKPEGFSGDDIFDLNLTRMEYKAAWHKVWMEQKLDVILCPGAPTTALPHDTYGTPPYTAVWNTLEYPGVIIPMGKADRNIDRDELAAPDMQRPYRSEDAHGAPTTIQLVGRSYQDEELIAAARMIDQCLAKARSQIF